MLDHISFAVNNFKQNLHFYDETLALLAIERLMTFETKEYNIAGYGKNNQHFFWIREEIEPGLEALVRKLPGLHIAFQAPSVKAIHTWYARCLELGSTDNGLPGPRIEYHPGYYAAFVIDPNGYKLEAVLHHYKS